uniref:FAD-binding PCMH-type domain-containing protein n=1 Tax=Anopheles christyi TaxID=43041 RepID=A0A182K1U4_9DIPT
MTFTPSGSAGYARTVERSNGSSYSPPNAKFKRRKKTEKLHQQDAHEEDTIEPGVCQVYTGTTCEQYLRNQTVFVTPDITMEILEERLKSAYGVIRESKDMNANCRVYALPSLCYSILPVCRTPELTNHQYFANRAAAEAAQRAATIGRGKMRAHEKKNNRKQLLLKAALSTAVPYESTGGNGGAPYTTTTTTTLTTTERLRVYFSGGVTPDLGGRFFDGDIVTENALPPRYDNGRRGRRGATNHYQQQYVQPGEEITVLSYTSSSSGPKKSYPPTRNTENLRRICRNDCELLENELCQKEYAIAKRHPTIGQKLPLEECDDLPLQKSVDGTILNGIGGLGSSGDMECMRLGIDLDIKPNDDCYWENGASYRGIMDRTKSSKICMRWSKLMHTMSEFPHLAGHNYCRNPPHAGPTDAPWCYVDMQKTIEYCDIPKCSDRMWMYIIIGFVAVISPLFIGIGVFCCRKYRKHGVSNIQNINLPNADKNIYGNSRLNSPIEMTSLIANQSSAGAASRNAENGGIQGEQNEQGGFNRKGSMLSVNTNRMSSQGNLNIATPSSSSSHHSLSRERNGDGRSDQQLQQQQAQPLLSQTQQRKHHHHSLEREKILRTNQLQHQQQLQQNQQLQQQQAVQGGPPHIATSRAHHQHHQHHHSLDRSNSGTGGRLDESNGSAGDQYETQSNRSFYHNASASRSNKSIHSMQEPSQHHHTNHHGHPHQHQQHVHGQQQPMGGGHPTQGYKNFSLPRKSIDSGLEYGLDASGADLASMAANSPGYPATGRAEMKARPPKDPHRHHHHHHHHGSGRSSRNRIDVVTAVGSSISSLPGSSDLASELDRQAQHIPKNSTQSLATGNQPMVVPQTAPGMPPIGRKPSHSGSILSVASSTSEQCGTGGGAISSFQPGFSSPLPPVGNGIVPGGGDPSILPQSALMQSKAMLSTLGSYIWGSAEGESPLTEVSFTINGKPYTADPRKVSVDTSLNTFIRNHAHLTGTKFMCLEGGCGACIVNVNGLHPVTKEKKSWAVNSCLFPVFACHGLDVVTVEGIGNRKDGYHPIQQRLAHLNGTQCGYCSPGMVMNMYSLMEANRGAISMEDVENAFGGNICRCTGYRPILDAFKSLAVDADETLLDACQDIEDLKKTCPKTGSPCAGKCPAAKDRVDAKRPVKLVFEDEKEWHRVSQVADIFTIFEQIGTKPYMLVAGNTAHEELHTHSASNSELVVGANVSLTEFMQILNTTANKSPSFSYCKQLEKHIDLIANVPVRSAGTIAGNLNIKNQHHEFPSDMYLILETVGAKLTLVESGDKTSLISPSEFIQLDMQQKLLKSVTLPALDATRYVFRSFKVMPRSQNAHAYVNGAFLTKFAEDGVTVESIKICFGGINPQFTHATATESFLVGKNLFDGETIQATMNQLSGEILPDWVLPDTSAEYRKNLAMALYYKYLLNVAPDGTVLVKPSFRSGGTVLERSLSSGQQSFDTYERNWPLTKNIPKIEALAQTSGEAKFTNDLPPQPGELYAAFVIATKPHTRIGKIDATDALKYPGVVAFYSAKDIPGTNNFMPASLGNQEVEEIFCSGEVLYHGQPVGVIVAETFNQANHAATLVNILYERVSQSQPVYPTLKSLVDNQTKMRIFDEPVTTTRRGSSYRVKVSAARKVTGRFEMAGQYHYTMETQTCVCVPIEDGMDVHSSTQWVDLCQVAIASMLKVPENSLNFTVRRLGGGYGSKISRAGQIACACALAAHLQNRPVRFVQTIESNMSSIGKRYGCITDYEVDVESNGRIVKLTNNYMQDYGASLNESVGEATTEFFNNCYDTKTWKVVGKAAKTDAPSNTWCRAPGTTEGIAMVENIMEHIAWELGLDPLELRLANMPEGSKMRELLPQFHTDVEYVQRKAEIAQFNVDNRWRKRGIAISLMRYPLGYFGALHALVAIHAGDGTVSVTHGGIEMGQGMNTKAAQVAAYVLGLPLEKISIKPTSSLTSPNAIVTGGSMTSEAVCYAVKKACELLLERIKPVRDAHKDVPWETVTQLCYASNVDLCATYQYRATELKPYIIWGLSCAEVEVDVLTGNVQLRRVDILEDTGESLSPGIDVGQIEGAFIMGVGYWLTEALVYNAEDGALLTNRTWTYKPPGAKDIPVDFRVRFLQKSSNPAGVLRSKATGEPALNMSIVVLFALRNALRSARKDAGLADDWIPMGLGCVEVRSAKILGIFPTTSKSHWILGSALMKELAQNGHEVTMISPFPLKNAPKTYRDVNIEYKTNLFEDVMDKVFENIDDSLVEKMMKLGNFVEVITNNTLSSPEVQGLLQSDETFDLLVLEIFLDDAFLGFADRFNCPVVGMSTFGASSWVNSLTGSPQPLSYVPHPMSSFTDKMNFWQRLGNVLFTAFDETLITGMCNPINQKYYNHFFPNATRSYEEMRRHGVSLVLINSHFSLSFPRPYLPNLIEVGGFHVNRKVNPLPEDIKTFIEQSEHGVIYFSMGSNLKPSKMDLQKRNDVIKVLSSVKQNIIWKWDDDTLVVDKKKFLIGKWFPQDDILAHPNVKLFITHGGLLSCTESIYHGVPIVGIPIFGDQLLNMARAEQTGWGIGVAYKELNEQTFSKAVTNVLNDPS